MSDDGAARTAILVALVVLVLGFGSGVGAVWERRSGSGSAGGRDLGGEVQESPTAPVEVEVAAGVAPTGRTTATSTAAAPPDVTSSTSTTSSTTSTTATTTTAPPPAVAEPGDSCPDLATGLLEPFLAHVRVAHLETPPGAQVADALDVDGYLLAHTSLLGRMLAPLFGVATDGATC